MNEDLKNFKTSRNYFLSLESVQILEKLSEKYGCSKSKLIDTLIKEKAKEVMLNE